jgi:hypothetical protein
MADMYHDRYMLVKSFLFDLSVYDLLVRHRADPVRLYIYHCRRKEPLSRLAVAFQTLLLGQTFRATGMFGCSCNSLSCSLSCVSIHASEERCHSSTDGLILGCTHSAGNVPVVAASALVVQTFVIYLHTSNTVETGQ